MKTILIIEDNKLEVDSLIGVIRKIETNARILTTDNFGDAIQKAISNNITLFIVDIVLNPKDKNDTSGIDFVETIRNLPQYKYIPVIFVTSLNDPKLYAYENLHCYQYIQKPLFYSDVEKTFREALEYHVPNEEAPPLKMKQDGILFIIPKHEIIYAFSKASKLTIVTEKETYVFFYRSCDELMEQLRSDKFIRCSRNAIVNKDKIHSFDQRKDIILLKDSPDIIKVGKQYKEDVARGIDE